MFSELNSARSLCARKSCHNRPFRGLSISCVPAIHVPLLVDHINESHSPRKAVQTAKHEGSVGSKNRVHVEAISSVALMYINFQQFLAHLQQEAAYKPQL